ncbi:MAG: Ppx/GppA phosphatase family protein [Halieaceae bacterium]|jgi:exopolyphosphatase/guanosine-5'-triphosphate,3'-diphosphate pyrophosphatase|nr:Ppx/GppA phosphatase family protein [Halieaceae bacterium]
MQQAVSSANRASPQTEQTLQDGAVLAAIDLGSNSFHLIVARVEHDEIRPVETLSEKVQLGAGLKDGVLDKAAIRRGMDCLARFKQVLDSVSPHRTRIVGTNALRQARNRRDFTQAAEALLGVPIDVIYGREEARLVYLGVAHTLADDEHSRLVVDIGGGSTEFIVGQRFEPQRLESLQMGCVSYTNQFFKRGRITERRYRKAYDAARLEVSHIRHRFAARHWEDCVGSSGTLQAIEGILVNSGWSEGGINRSGLASLEKALLTFDHIDKIDLQGLSDTRRNVILSGVAITAGIFDELGVDIMRPSRGALREGVIYDLLGRLSHEDVRERTLNALLQRYNADLQIADTVEARARTLFDSTSGPWELTSDDWSLLRWAARGHEIGMSISHKHYNRHGAYLLRNADLPGFSQNEQETLALLVLCHRRKVPLEVFDSHGEQERMRLLRLTTLLRLACAFKYVEQLESLPEFRVSASRRRLKLSFPEDWLDKHPLTHYELKQERLQAKKLGIKISLR